MKIKKIIYIPSYKCKGVIDNMNHMVVTMERDKIKYSLVPLGEAHINNCLIDFTYTPSHYVDESIVHQEDKSANVYLNYYE